MAFDNGRNSCDPLQWLQVHGDALYAYCMIRVRNPGIAEDLVQETLLAALQAVESFRGQSSERTWLIGILKHKLCDHLRACAREQPLNEQETSYDDASEYFDESGHWKIEIGEWNNPQASLEKEQFWMALNECIGRLPERLRILYTLRELDDMGTHELIDTLNISSEGNLWVMMSRARVQLRQCMESRWFSA